MGLIDRVLGRPTSNPDQRTDRPAVELRRPKRIDPFLGDRELRAAYRVLVDGDWNRLERFLEVSPKNWMFASIVLGPTVDMETIVFERWVDVRRSPRARTFLANALVRDAYVDFGIDDRHDGGGQALVVDGLAGIPLASNIPAQFEELTSEEETQLITRLTAAEEVLYEVVGERPALVDPWVGLLTSGRGLQVDLHELRERFESAHSRSPFRPDACHNYLVGLTKRWGGSSVASFDLARWIELEASPTSAAKICLPTAHIEQALVDHGPSRLAETLAEPEIASELATGLLRYLEAIPDPAPVPTLGVLNAYALALTVFDAASARLLRETLRRIDDRPTEWPWLALSDDVATAFAEVTGRKRREADRF